MTIGFIYDFSGKSNEISEQIIYLRTIKAYNRVELLNKLFESIWYSNISDVNVMANRFVEDIQNILNIMCLRRVNEFQQKYINNFWIIDEITECMGIRNNLYRLKNDI